MWKWVLLGLGALVLAFVGAIAYLILRPINLISTEAAADPAHDVQIVVQWPLDEPPDARGPPPHIVYAVRSMLAIKAYFDLEGTLAANADGAYRDGGNDIGSGTFNVFLYSREPNTAVRHIVEIYRAGMLKDGMRIGVAHYKNTTKTDWNYVSAFPPGDKEFKIQYDRQITPRRSSAKESTLAPSK